MRGLADYVLAVLERHFQYYMKRHYDSLDGREMLPAEFRRAQAEVIVDAAIDVAKELEVAWPEWLREGNRELAKGKDRPEWLRTETISSE